MGEVVRLSGGTATLQAAVDAFLDHHDLTRSTRRVYRASLASLVAGLGPATAVGELSGPRLAGWFGDRYAAAAPATWNRELATLRAAVGWWRRRGWLAGDPSGDLERRRERVDRTWALTRRQLERLFARRDLPRRERTLWRLLYETAARANELLALNVEDLDLANRRARVHSKGGAVEWVFWQTGSAQLLPRLLAGRTGGPVFLGDRRPTRAVAGLDLDPTSGRARLSYRRAAELFRVRTGWTLHQLRHSALTLVLLGTGLRFGEFAGLRRRRVHLERTPPVLQVVDVRYQAGRFGSGFKPRPKSDAGIREIPLAPLLVEVIRSQFPPGADPDALVFVGPGGGNHVAAGTRTVLSRHGVRRMYQTAVKRADLGHLQLRGPHDFRHTFSTWLEDAGIPARVIDELMGHQRSRHGDLDGGSRIGARYRHTTDDMAARVVDAIEARLQIVLRVAEVATRVGPNRESFRVF